MPTPLLSTRDMVTYLVGDGVPPGVRVLTARRIYAGARSAKIFNYGGSRHGRALWYPPEVLAYLGVQIPSRGCCT